MKTTIRKNKLRCRCKAHTIFLFGAVLFTIHLYGGEITREYTGSSAVSKTDLIEMVTSHCRNMTINTTNSNEASYKVKITIETSDEETAREMLNELHFDMNKSASGVKMNLDWPFRNFTSSGGIMGKTKVTLHNGNKYNFNGKFELRMEIDVNIPKDNPIELGAKHSTINLGHTNNKAEIDIGHSTLYANDLKSVEIDASHSHIKMGNISSEARISLSHSKFEALKTGNTEIFCSHSPISIVEIGNSSIQLSHSNAEFEKTGNLNAPSVQHSDLIAELAENVTIASSSHSNIKINQAHDVDIRNGQHGKIRIKEMNSFDYNSGGYTQLHLGLVKKAIDIDTRHSNIIIDELSSNIQLVDIENEFASVTLEAGNISDFELFVNGGKYSTVNVPGGVVKKSDGYYTKGKSTPSPLEIKLQCEHCTINIR